MAASLPNLAGLGPAQLGAAPKRKWDADSELYFKAYRKGPFRKLSNLFGPVEWLYQQQKFRDGSDVHAFLQRGLQREVDGTWTEAEFRQALKDMQHGGQAQSYIDEDGALATGLLAQMTSQIAREPTSLLARKRLTYIKQHPSLMTEQEALAWHAVYVNPPLTDEAADALMHRLLLVKYRMPRYRALLLETGTRALHEGKGRGAPSKWEWQEKPLSEEEQRRGFTRGGDVLGRLLMRVRAEITE